MSKTFDVVIYKDDETNSYWGYRPNLYGCNTSGKTIEEVRENIKEAISLCLEDDEPMEYVREIVDYEYEVTSA